MSSVSSVVIFRIMTPAPIKPIISLEVLNQIDIRVGTILVGRRRAQLRQTAPAARQLWRSRTHHRRRNEDRTRQSAERLSASRRLFVVNLEPRKMRGVLSEGMLFDIGYADGVRPVLAMPENPVPDGTRAG